MIFQKINEHYQKNLPFVAYRKPNENRISVFLQKTQQVYTVDTYQEEGFVFASFDSLKSPVLIPKQASDFIQEDVVLMDDQVTNSGFFEESSSQEQRIYIDLVDKAVDAIKNKEFEKVVLSRCEKIALSTFDVTTIFKRLLKKYKTAFVYVWWHPKVGLWFGATPETLIRVTSGYFETMSLAGTQVFKEGLKKVTWKQKELHEQEYVTRFIYQELSKVCRDVYKSATETIKAGGLIHLKTKLYGNLFSNTNLKGLLEVLHPTPAVCGFPKEESKQFILQNENYNRDFYTGYLGEMNLVSDKQNQVDLFVNLRCMQIVNDIAYLYVGGGVVLESDANKEYQETIAKSRTMKAVL